MVDQVARIQVVLDQAAGAHVVDQVAGTQVLDQVVGAQVLDQVAVAQVVVDQMAGDQVLDQLAGAQVVVVNQVAGAQLADQVVGARSLGAGSSGWQERFSVIFLDACTDHSCSPSNVFISDLVTPHIHLSILISFTSSRASCPRAVAQVSIQQSWSDHSCVNLQLHCHPPVTQHSTASLPVPHAALTLCDISVNMPPVSSTLEPRYLK